MQISPQLRRSQAGSTLAMVIVIGGVMSIIIAGMLQLGSFSLGLTHGRNDWNAAFFHAENALHWSAQRIADTNLTASNYFSSAAGTLNLTYMAPSNAAGSGFSGAWTRVVRTNSSLTNIYLVTTSARVGTKVRTMQAVVNKNPPSQVFDYEYFLNNWGWWWGSPITGNGANRANWDFDFRGDPTVNGFILANGSITENGVPVNQYTNNPPFSGTAGSDPIAYAHAGVPRLEMPNLRDFNYYTNKALAGISTNGLWVGTNRIVFGVQTNTSKPGLYLVGTDSSPIIISNTVVIPGDVILSGKITGRGTLYVGGNLYLAGDVTYKNGPDWTASPEIMASAQRNQWVADNHNKDLIAFAVRESILGGDVTSSAWKSYCYDAAAYGLKNVGDEASLGADGIASTGDDGIAYLDTNGDGTPDSSWFDADGDGVVDAAFNYSTQLTMTTSRANLIQGYPTASGSPVAYNTVASNNMNLLDGIFYTNHAAAMRLAKNNALFHGIIVSRDEAIVFSSTLKFIYDSRVHSRYNNDPNQFIDLGLPVAGVIRLTNFTEQAPDATNL